LRIASSACSGADRAEGHVVLAQPRTGQDQLRGDFTGAADVEHADVLAFEVVERTDRAVVEHRQDVREPRGLGEEVLQVQALLVALQHGFVADPADVAFAARDERRGGRRAVDQLDDDVEVLLLVEAGPVGDDVEDVAQRERD
jgi:hypothetical protein